MSTSDEFAGEAWDPSGVRIVLPKRVWRHKIAVDHPEMKPLAEDILRAVSKPDHLEDDPVRPNRVRYYSHETGPSSWLVVVVSYEQIPARIISAFAKRKDPPTWNE